MSSGIQAVPEVNNDEEGPIINPLAPPSFSNQPPLEVANSVLPTDDMYIDTDSMSDTSTEDKEDPCFKFCGKCVNECWFGLVVIVNVICIGCLMIPLPFVMQETEMWPQIKEVLDALSIAITIGSVLAGGFIWWWRQRYNLPNNLLVDKMEEIKKKRECLTITVGLIFGGLILVVGILYAVWLIQLRPSPTHGDAYEKFMGGLASAFTIGAVLAAGIVTCLKKLRVSCLTVKDADVDDQA